MNRYKMQKDVLLEEVTTVEKKLHQNTVCRARYGYTDEDLQRNLEVSHIKLQISLLLLKGFREIIDYKYVKTRARYKVDHHLTMSRGGIMSALTAFTNAFSNDTVGGLKDKGLLKEVKQLTHTIKQHDAQEFELKSLMNALERYRSRYLQLYEDDPIMELLDLEFEKLDFLMEMPSYKEFLLTE